MASNGNIYFVMSKVPTSRTVLEGSADVVWYHGVFDMTIQISISSQNETTPPTPC